MTRFFKVILISIVAVMPGISFGQLHPAPSVNATITTDNCVSLDATQPLQDFYAIDISHLGLSSEAAAKKHFGHIENNLITYHVDFANSKVILELHLDRVATDKDLVWWNEYLTSLCK